MCVCVCVCERERESMQWKECLRVLSNSSCTRAHTLNTHTHTHTHTYTHTHTHGHSPNLGKRLWPVPGLVQCCCEEPAGQDQCGGVGLQFQHKVLLPAQDTHQSLRRWVAMDTIKCTIPSEFHMVPRTSSGVCSVSDVVSHTNGVRQLRVLQYQCIQGG